MAKLNIDGIISKIDDIDVMPGVMTEVMTLSKDPDSTVAEMEKVILADQALTTKVLRFANSAYYGYARKISTISKATILLGFDSIKSIALASSMSDLLSAPFTGYALDKNELWIQSQTCGLVSRYIAVTIGFPNPEEAYISGLLRDIGKTVLNEYMITEYKSVFDLVLNNKLSFCEAEKEVFGFNHSEIGAKMAEKWNLPSHLVEAIKYHHNPTYLESLDENKLVSIVHLGDAMTMMMGVGVGIDGLTYSLSNETLASLDVDIELFKRIITGAAELVKDQNNYV